MFKNNCQPTNIEKQSASSDDEWSSVSETDNRKATKKAWDVGFRVGGNFSIPLGDYYEGIEAGIGFEGDFMVAITDEVALRATISKAGLKWEEEFGFFSLDPNYEFIDQDVSLKVIRYLLSVQFCHDINTKKPGQSMWYAVAGLGATFHKTTYKGKLRNTVTGETVPLEEPYSETKLTTSTGFGIIQLISKNIGIDASVNYDLLFIGTAEYDGKKRLQTAGILDFKLALITLL